MNYNIIKYSMKRTILVASLFLLISWTSVFGQMCGNYLYNTNQILQNTSRGPASNAIIQNSNEFTIVVNGLMNIVADDYTAIFNIVQVGETIEATDQLMANRISIFKQKLLNIGFDTNEVRVDMISFVPRFDIQTESKLFSKSYNEVPAGYELQKNISIHFKKSSMLDAIMTAATYAEIYDIVKVDYFATNLQRELDSLRVKCLNEVKAKVKSYEKIGFKLDTLKKIISDNFTTTYPQTRYFNYQAYSRPSLNAAKKKQSSTPVINEVPKTNTKFYSQLSYDLYDLVINPVVTEPVIQISYSVSVKYFFKEEEEKPKDKYFIINPTGDVKQFPR